MKGERIAILQKEKGIKSKEIQEKLSVSNVTLYRWKKNLSEPDDETKSKLAKILGTTVSYLMGETSLDSKFGVPNGKEIKDVVMVPIINSHNITACCGNGTAYASDVQWEVEGSFPVPSECLSGYTWQGCSFKIIRAEGVSMEPVIHDGDMVIFAENCDIDEGDIAIVTLNSKVFIKGIIKLGRESAVLRSYNWQFYPDVQVDLTAGDSEFGILGKVIRILSINKAPSML